MEYLLSIIAYGAIIAAVVVIFYQGADNDCNQDCNQGRDCDCDNTWKF